MRPVIAVTCDRRLGAPGPGPNVRPSRMEVVVGEAVVDRIRAAGEAPVLLPPGDAAAAEELLERVDALVVTGGAFDIHPRHYGQGVTGRLDRVDDDRTGLELALLRTAFGRMPVLGICGGMQAMVVARGGTLHQDVPGHEQPTDPAGPWHDLVTAHPLLPRAVNSTHHQAVDDPADLVVIARAPDGVVEAVAGPGFTLGVQWHPEHLDGRLFRALVEAVALGSRP